MLKQAASLLLVALLMVGEALGQTGRFAYIGRYQYTGTSGKITLQLPTSSVFGTARLLELFLSCPTQACTVTYTVLGGLATSTEAPLYRLRSLTPLIPAVKFFTASNASGGTVLPDVPLPSGFVGTLNVRDIELLKGEAVSITVTSASQTVTIGPKVEVF